MTNKTNKVVHQVNKTAKLYLNIKQLLDEVEQNIIRGGPFFWRGDEKSVATNFSLKPLLSASNLLFF